MEFMWYFFLKLTNMSFLISIFFFELRLLYINFEHTSFDYNHSLTCQPHTHRGTFPNSTHSLDTLYPSFARPSATEFAFLFILDT
jgi:hypothetical protein